LVSLDRVDPSLVPGGLTTCDFALLREARLDGGSNVAKRSIG